MEAEKVWRDEIGKMGERVAKIMKKEKGKSGETHGKKGKEIYNGKTWIMKKKKKKIQSQIEMFIFPTRILLLRTE